MSRKKSYTERHISDSKMLLRAVNVNKRREVRSRIFRAKIPRAYVERLNERASVHKQTKLEQNLRKY